MAPPQPTPDRSSPEGLVAAMRQLPPAAHILARLQRLLADPNSALEDVADLIRLDAALTTRVIQISNSAWFGRGAPCGTIFDAVNRVGFREVYHLVAVVASGAVVAKSLPAYGRNAMTMWRESVSCAFAAEILAERLGEPVVVAYTAGLLHGIGRLAINQYVASSVVPGEEIKQLPDDGFPLDYSSAEFALLGYTQAEVAASMLRKWDFTPSIIEPIRLQYEPLVADEPHDKTAAILYGARLLRTVFCQNIEVPDLVGEEEIFATMHLSRTDVLGYLPALKEQLSRVNRMTGA